jgi:hypothetical protein
VSVTFRSIDMAVCGDTLFEGRKLGTHFVWHLLNALTLFLLLRASFEVGPAGERRKTPEPSPIPLPPPPDEKPAA